MPDREDQIDFAAEDARLGEEPFDSSWINFALLIDALWRRRK